MGILKTAFYLIWIIIGLFVIVGIYGCVKVGEITGEAIAELEEDLDMDENLKAGIEMFTTDRSDIYNWVKTGMTKQQVNLENLLKHNKWKVMLVG